MSNFKKEFKEFMNLLREKNDYFLSHHPMCSRFDDDVYHFAGKRLCVGCFTAYPVGSIIFILWIIDFIQISTPMAFFIGISFGVFQFLSLTDVSEYKIGKILIKVFLGLGIGFFMIGIFSLPIHLFLRVILFLICINIAALYSFLRMRKITKICQGCEYEKDWSNCPGFKKSHSR